MLESKRDEGKQAPRVGGNCAGDRSTILSPSKEQQADGKHRREQTTDRVRVSE